MFNLEKTIAISLAAAAVAGFAVSAQAQTNNFANGGFETAGTTSPAASWLQANQGYVRTSAEFHSGSFSAALGTLTSNSATIALQNSVKDGLMAQLTQGDTLRFSFWAKGFAGDTGNAIYALRYLSSNGDILASSNNQSFGDKIKTTGWTNFTFDMPMVPVGAAAAFIEFSHGIGTLGLDSVSGNTFKGGTIYIDDISLKSTVTAVPEPESYAMFMAGLGGLGFLIRRRRQS